MSPQTTKSKLIWAFSGGYGRGLSAAMRVGAVGSNPMTDTLKFLITYVYLRDFFSLPMMDVNH